MKSCPLKGFVQNSPYKLKICFCTGNCRDTSALKQAAHFPRGNLTVELLLHNDCKSFGLYFVSSGIAAYVQH